MVPVSVPPELLRLAGPGAAARWDDLTPIGRRQVVQALVEVTINKSGKRLGTHGFDPNLIQITWR